MDSMGSPPWKKNMAAWGNHCAIKCKTWMCLRCPANKITKYSLWILQTVYFLISYWKRKGITLNTAMNFKTVSLYDNIYIGNILKPPAACVQLDALPSKCVCRATRLVTGLWKSLGTSCQQFWAAVVIGVLPIVLWATGPITVHLAA